MPNGNVKHQNKSDLEKLIELAQPDKVQDVSLSLDSLYDEASLSAKEAQVHIQGLANFYKLRNRWSIYLMIVIASMVLFQMTITILVGTKTLNFFEYKYLVYVVIGENFLQIVGMGLVVVKALFKSNGSKNHY